MKFNKVFALVICTLMILLIFIGSIIFLAISGSTSTTIPDFPNEEGKPTSTPTTYPNSKVEPSKSENIEISTTPSQSISPTPSASTVPSIDNSKDNTFYYIITDEERELLARIVTCESSICSLECQKDVCSVIFNRLESGKWRKDMNGDGQITLYDIIYYPNAFTPASNGALDRCTTPCKSAYEAVDYVVKNGPTVPTYVRYFRTSYDFKWDGYSNYKVIDNVYFGYFNDWKNGAW